MNDPRLEMMEKVIRAQGEVVGLDELGTGLQFLRSQQITAMHRLGHVNLDKDTLARYGHALMIESAEYANALPWKEWKRYGDGDGETPVDHEHICEEFVDVLHFLGTHLIILLAMGVSIDDVLRVWSQKHGVNEDRLNGRVAGYGIS